jgi:hypothetical protein
VNGLQSLVQLIFSARASRKQIAEASEVIFAADNLARILQKENFDWSMLLTYFNKLQAEQGLDEVDEFDKVLFGFKEAVSTNYLRDNNPDDDYKVLNAVKASLDSLKCDPKERNKVTTLADKLARLCNYLTMNDDQNPINLSTARALG